jgi:hypothetical protein
MKRVGIYFLLLLISLATVLAEPLITETISATTVPPSGTVSLTYKVSGTEGKVGWVVSRGLPTDWTVVPIGGLFQEGNKLGYLGANLDPVVITLKAPASPGTYPLYSGEWGIVDSVNSVDTTKEGTFPEVVLTVSGGQNTCQTDGFTCPDGSRVGRNPQDNCNFFPCVDKPQCSDAKDNDGDSLMDYPADPGCTSATDTSEVNSGGASGNTSICTSLPVLMADSTMNCVIWGFIALFALMMFMNMMPRR